MKHKAKLKRLKARRDAFKRAQAYRRTPTPAGAFTRPGSLKR